MYDETKANSAQHSWLSLVIISTKQCMTLLSVYLVPGISELTQRVNILRLSTLAYHGEYCTDITEDGSEIKLVLVNSSN